MCSREGRTTVIFMNIFCEFYCDMNFRYRYLCDLNTALPQFTGLKLLRKREENPCWIQRRTLEFKGGGSHFDGEAPSLHHVRKNIFAQEWVLFDPFIVFVRHFDALFLNHCQVISGSTDLYGSWSLPPKKQTDSKMPPPPRPENRTPQAVGRQVGWHKQIFYWLSVICSHFTEQYSKMFASVGLSIKYL